MEPNVNGKFVHLSLSDDQKRMVERETGRVAEAIELTVQELEDRIAPRLSSNHNETLLSAI